MESKLQSEKSGKNEEHDDVESKEMYFEAIMRRIKCNTQLKKVKILIDSY